MAKDYFQDITPPQGGGIQRPPVKPAAAPVEEEYDDGMAQDIPIRIDENGPKGIRSITPPRASARAGRVDAGIRPPRSYEERSVDDSGEERRGHGRWWLWGIAAFGIIFVVGLLLLALRPTTVTISPRSHTISLNAGTPFMAYPAATAASGTLAYTITTLDLEDSAAVTASATTSTAAAKASGSITVYNAYSASSVKLIKNTRFQTPDGLVFRAPADIVVPGEKGGVPGSVTVTVVADQTGEKYNVDPVSRFSLPGLTGNAAMYKGVYAKSTTAMSGGASASNGPSVDPHTLSSTIAQLKSNLAAKVRDTAIAQASATDMIIPDLIQITYTDKPNTPEAGGAVRVHESAHVTIPVFQAVALGQTVASVVAADAEHAPITLVPGKDFAAQYAGAAPVLGADPMQFALTGQANLMWSVDVAALQAALAGKNQSAFQTIISGFSGIQEAHAKIEPFWKSSFPSEPSKIRVVVTSPKADQ